MTINGSPDISVLQLQVAYDISGLSPVITIQNQSQGTNLPGLVWWFVVTSPSGALIHEGSFDQPDINAQDWSTFTINDPWPQPMNQIEWNGPYNVTVYVQDTSGNQFSDDSYTAIIKRPNGNTSLSKNTFGIATTDVKVKCNEARIYFENTTNTSYNGSSGTRISTLLKVVYPIDPTATVPAPFSAPFNSPVLVPIAYNSKNYQFLSQIIYSYDYSQYVSIIIRYQQLETFAVQCNIDLVPLVCEVTKLIDSIEDGSCVDANEAQRKLNLIIPKLSLAVMGIMQPLTGVDVPELIDEIIAIGGFDCDCCNPATGIIPQSGSVIDGYSFSVIGSCGDITGTVQQNGSNITFTLQDKSYIFNLSPTIPTTAFSITPATVGCVKTYTLNVNMVQFGTDLANTILSNASLINLWNSVLNQSGSDIKFIVDGKCVFTSSQTYNYTFTLANVPSNTTFAVISSVLVSGIAKQLSFSLNLTNIAAFQTYLNSLGLGSFTVTNPSGNNVLITSNSNPNLLSTLVYSISASSFIADFTSTASGFVPVTATFIIQSIINYLCGLTDGNLKTSQDYTITYIDENGDVQETTIPAGTSLADFIADLIKYNAETIQNIGTIASVTCGSIKAAFGQSNKPIGSTDYLLGTNGGGVCAQVFYLDAFKYMLQAAATNADAKAMFCQLAVACAEGLVCEPYDYLDVVVTPYNPACSSIVGIEFVLS